MLCSWITRAVMMLFRNITHTWGHPIHIFSHQTFNIFVILCLLSSPLPFFHRLFSCQQMVLHIPQNATYRNVIISICKSRMLCRFRYVWRYISCCFFKKGNRNDVLAPFDLWKFLGFFILLMHFFESTLVIKLFTDPVIAFWSLEIKGVNYQFPFFGLSIRLWRS